MTVVDLGLVVVLASAAALVVVEVCKALEDGEPCIREYPDDLTAHSTFVRVSAGGRWTRTGVRRRSLACSLHSWKKFGRSLRGLRGDLGCRDQRLEDQRPLGAQRVMASARASLSP